MQKFLVVAFILFSSLTAAAQKADEPKALSNTGVVEFTKRVETERTISAPAPSITPKRTQTDRVVDGRIVRVGPTTTYLKNGLSTDEVLRVLGKPIAISERREGERQLVTYTFRRSEGRVLVAEFERGLLVSSRMESAGEL